MSMTMKQIAELAGVHRSTVDKVIHNRPGVSEEVRSRIQKIIEMSGYTPNQAGIALQNQSRSFQVDVILMQTDSTAYFQKGIERAAAEFPNSHIHIEYHLISKSNSRKMLAVLEKIKETGLSDGIIIVPHNEPELIKAVNTLQEEGTPVVCLNSEAENCRSLFYVGPGNQVAGGIAAHLMAEFIHKKGDIAIITSAALPSSSNYSVEMRLKVFQKYMRDRCPGIRIVQIIENFESHRLTDRLTRKLLSDYPDLKGIYCTSGGVSGIGTALEAMNRQGKVTVITHELYPEILALIKKGVIICTIGSELTVQGQIAMKTMLNYLLYRTVPKEKTHYTKSEVIIAENIDVAEP